MTDSVREDEISGIDLSDYNEFCLIGNPDDANDFITLAWPVDEAAEPKALRIRATSPEKSESLPNLAAKVATLRKK